MPAPLCFAAWLLPILIQAPVQAPTPAPTQTATPGREFFISWGYNGDSYTKSDMHFSQPGLGNDFTLAGVQAREVASHFLNEEKWKTAARAERIEHLRGWLKAEKAYEPG